MLKIFNQHMFKGMGKWAVADIMQQDSDFSCCCFLRGNFCALVLKFGEGQPHKVIGTQSMVQPGMNRARIDQMGQSHLLDPAKALEIGMG